MLLLPVSSPKIDECELLPEKVFDVFFAVLEVFSWCTWDGGSSATFSCYTLQELFRFRKHKKLAMHVSLSSFHWQVLKVEWIKNRCQVGKCITPPEALNYLIPQSSSALPSAAAMAAASVTAKIQASEVVQVSAFPLSFTEHAYGEIEPLCQEEVFKEWLVMYWDEHCGIYHDLHMLKDDEPSFWMKLYPVIEIGSLHIYIYIYTRSSLQF